MYNDCSTLALSCSCVSPSHCFAYGGLDGSRQFFLGVSNQGRTRLSPDKVCIQYELDYTQSVFFVCVSFEGRLCIATLRPGVGWTVT